MEINRYLDQLKDPQAQVSVASLQRLDTLEPEEAEELRASWGEVDAERRRQVVQQVTELAEDNVDLNFDAVFLTALEDEDAGVRTGAVRGLWEYEQPDLIPRLLRMLEKDEEPEVRADAALALGRFVMKYATGDLRQQHYAEVEDGLRRALEDELEVEEVRARALEAIGASNREWVEDAIESAYTGEERRMRVSAVHAMGRNCEPRWLPALAEEITSSDPEMRYEAATALGSLADRRGIRYLAAALADPDPEVKEASILALGQIGGSEAKSLLKPLLGDPSARIREAAAEAAAEADFAVDPLTVEYEV